MMFLVYLSRLILEVDEKEYCSCEALQEFKESGNQRGFIRRVLGKGRGAKGNKLKGY